MASLRFRPLNTDPPRGCSHPWRGPHLVHLSTPFVQLSLSTLRGGGDRKAGQKKGQTVFPLGQSRPPWEGFSGED